MSREERSGIADKQDYFNLQPVVEALSRPDSYEPVFHSTLHPDVHMPAAEELERSIEMLRSVLFPGFFLHSELRPNTMSYYIGATLDKCARILTEQIKRGFCFSCGGDHLCQSCETRAIDASRLFISRLPEIRRLLARDARAAYEGDPAAHSVGEAIFCYPSLMALTNHRIAHELYKLEVPLIPRMISEMAHSRSGIDIHPGARIDEGLFIDHGTGVVIGETSIIGKGVRIYQGVTLGAKSFPLDEEGKPIKGIPRHPIVEDRVTIYAGATILGRVTIGAGAEIGGNVWITRDVPAGDKVSQKRGD